MIAPQLNPPLLANCLVGANPIIWSNDDFDDLAGDLSLDDILSDMREAGYAGTELGHAYPRDPARLGKALQRHNLRLISGWHSTRLASRSLADEETDFLEYLGLLKSLGARVAIVAECTHAIHGQRGTPLGYGTDDRRGLQESEWARVIAGMEHLTGLAGSEGMQLTYHHHMGTVIQTVTELDRLLTAVPAMRLLFDPGHLVFAGIDPLVVMDRYGPRIAHVHLKSARVDKIARSCRERWSFYRAVTEGVFTIPGDGCVDFPAIFARLAGLNYAGWLVVEAEEDPVKVPALPKATAARAYVREQTGV
jgi:myo-inosose-2 dehydratase